MTITQVPPDVRPTLQLRQRRQLEALDYKRQVATLAGRYTQTELAGWLKVAQPALSQTIKTATALPPVKEGFSGAGPEEICERYAAGLIDRNQLLDELTRWEYAPRAEDDGYDGLIVSPPGSFMEVEMARFDGLIDWEIYQELLDRLRELGR